MLLNDDDKKNETAMLAKNRSELCRVFAQAQASRHKARDAKCGEAYATEILRAR